MMKKFYALLIAAAMMISVTACGSKTPAKEVQSDLEQMEAEVWEPERSCFQSWLLCSL